jgi:macrolide transport system ATP-binding/permease protein
VRAVSVTHHPLLGQGTWMGPVLPAGKEEKTTIHILMTGPGFFPTMQIPILMGRAIDGRDHAGAPPVAVVNESYVKTYFGSQNPLGQHLVITRREPFPKADVEIVGVARNARYGGLRGDYKDIVYLSYSQGSYYPVDEMTFALRTGGDPLRYVNTVRAIVRQADPRVPVTKIKTQAAQIDQIMNQQIIFARLCTGFAVLALLIACVGLYGTMSYMTARRTGEIGIRVALGAPRGSVVWMVLREVLAMSTVGLAISVPAALGAAKLVVSFLYGVKPGDSGSTAMAVGILLSAVLLAGFVPARKASRIDPMTALRQE